MRRVEPTSKSIATLAATLLLGIAALTSPLRPEASDHLDAPGLTSPGSDGRLDINDLYAFQSPADPGNAVIVLTVAPVAGIFSPTVFHPGASYNIFVDQNGDARKDLSYRIDFSPPALNGAQSVRVRCVPASRCNYGRGRVIAEGVTGQTIPLPFGGQVVADLFDDPFFFDLDAFVETDGRQFCDGNERDFFANLNTLGIVLEVPASDLGQAIGVWATTKLDGQVDRVGRPAINTVFIPSDFKNAYNEAKPRKDQKAFGEFLGEFSEVLLPDILTVDTTNPQGFMVLNGRQLADDVIDIELSLLGANPPGDCVDENDVAFSQEFPYLAAAH